MITRLVKMTFLEDRCNDFEAIFAYSQKLIAAMPGCHHVELLRSKQAANIYFTRSIWDGEDDLNAYRNSDLFKNVWKRTRALFADKPEAWSTELVLHENA